MHICLYTELHIRCIHTRVVLSVEIYSNYCTFVCRSVSLLLQASLPCLHFAAGPTECHLIGGTNADLAPPIDYIEKVIVRCSYH